MKIYKITLLAVLILALAACAVPGGEATEPVDPVEPTEPTTGPAAPEYSLEWLAGLPEGNILLQLDYEPTFSLEEHFYVFGRVPPFTLYADGTVVFESMDEASGAVRIMTVRITPEETLTVLRDVKDAGFEGLEDQLDFCYTDESGEQMCLADAPYTILRATLPDGELREVKTYADFSNDKGAFDEIILILSEFDHTRAELYYPQQAVLLIRALPGDFEVPVREWPLAVAPVPGEQLSAIILDAREAETFINAVGQNTGSFFFEVSGMALSAHLAPWLPYANYTDEVAEAFPAPTPPPVEEPFMIIQEKAIADLAAALGISAEEIVVKTFIDVTWPNGCLGINYPDMACTQALVPGYQLFLEAGGETYEYRADREGNQVVPAGDDVLPPVEDPEA
ncbi:MAG TPA: hypothetical protein VMN57_11915 [Anaerolineales bacterium]|nr:hypothetical protein [Anaerolineales bacterium]